MRPATLSPSQFKKIMTTSRGGKGFGKTAESYAEEVAMRMLGVEIDDFESFDMKRGTELEPFAIEAYTRETLIEVDAKERVWHPEYDYISGETDGFINDDGIIEVKCPKSQNHMKNLLTGEQVELYYDQMQGYMWLTDRKWCDFVSYDDRFPEPYHIYIHRVLRDDERIAELEERCVAFWHELVLPLHEQIKKL